MFKILAFFLTMALPIPARAAADCATPTSRSGVLLHAAEAEQAFAQLNGARFATAREEAFGELACLGDRLLPEDAARLHALMGLLAFTRGDDPLAVNSFHAAVAARPGYVLPLDLVPEDHPLRLQYKLAASLGEAPGWPVGTKPGACVLVDGTESSTIPADRPFLAQRVDDNSVLGTIYVTTPVSRPQLPEWLQAPPIVEPGASTHHPWLAVAGTATSAVVAAAFWTLAWDRQTALKSGTEPYEDLPGLRTEANAFSTVAVGGAVAAIGFGAVAVVRW